MVLSGLYGLLAGISAVTSLLGKVPANSQDGPPIFKASAPKGAPIPYVVIHKVNALPAGESLDGVSDLIDGEFQFDSYANDQETSQKVTRAVRDALKNYSGALNDGTTIQFTSVTAELDDSYEVGGQGYLFRSLVRLKAMYTEGQ